jgi:hypothetical protein
MEEIIDYLKENNGITYNLRTKAIVEDSDGFFVSLMGYDTELICNEELPVTIEDIESYIKRNETILHVPGMYMGIWIDTERDVMCFDASLKINDLERAIYVGIINKQKCIYDAKRGCIIKVPSPQTSGTMTQQKEYNKAKAVEVAKEYMLKQ